MAKSRESGIPSLPSRKTHSQASLSLRAKDSVRAELAARLSSHPLSKVAVALRDDAGLCLVGGSVRDAFTGLSEFDFDLATRLSAEEVLKRLSAHGVHAIDVGMRHGTIIAVIDRENIEITTYRKILADGTVGTGSEIEEDLAGRDFTINAIAFSAESHEFIDPFKGCADLEAGVVRAVGAAEARFKEDPLRLLRLIRFGPASGRSIECGTESAALSTFPLIRSVSPERIRVELERILLSEFPGAAFRFLHRLGGIELLLPEVAPSIGVEQNEFHTEDVFDHTMTVIERTPREPVLRWAALFHDLGKPATISVGDDGRTHFYGHERVSAELGNSVMDRLKFSNADREAISLIVREHMRPMDCGMPGTRRILRDLGVQFDRWREFKKADAPPVMPQEEFDAKLARFDGMVKEERERPKGSIYSALAIDGNDLIALGIKPGPALGVLLKQVQEAVIEDPEMNEREKLLEFVKRMVTHQ